MSDAITFDSNCRRCERLATFLDGVRVDFPSYHARPVAPFGVANPRLLIVGLAPETTTDSKWSHSMHDAIVDGQFADKILMFGNTWRQAD